MTAIPCPAPDCTTTWPAASPAEVLTRLIDLHARTAHPAPSAVASYAGPITRPLRTSRDPMSPTSYSSAATMVSGKTSQGPLGPSPLKMSPQFFPAWRHSQFARRTSWLHGSSCNRCDRTEMNLCEHSEPASVAKQAFATTRSHAPASKKWTTAMLWYEMPSSGGWQMKRYAWIYWARPGRTWLLKTLSLMSKPRRVEKGPPAASLGRPRLLPLPSPAHITTKRRATSQAHPAP